MIRNRLIDSAKDVVKHHVTAALTDCLKVYGIGIIEPLLTHCLYD